MKGPEFARFDTMLEELRKIRFGLDEECVAEGSFARMAVEQCKGFVASGSPGVPL